MWLSSYLEGFLVPTISTGNYKFYLRCASWGRGGNSATLPADLLMQHLWPGIAGPPISSTKEVASGSKVRGWQLRQSHDWCPLPMVGTTYGWTPLLLDPLSARCGKPAIRYVSANVTTCSGSHLMPT